MSDNPEHGFPTRGYINAEANDLMISLAIQKMEEWIKAAELAIALATKPKKKVPPELKQELIQKAQKLIQKALEEKKELDELRSQAIYNLNNSERVRISEPVDQMNQLEITLNENLLKSQGEGRTKKKSRRRRNKRHRKSTHRRRHRKY
jgi:hypothetical protein